MVDSLGYTCARRKPPSLEEDGAGDTRMVALPLKAGSVVGLGDRFQGSTPLCGAAIRISRLDGEDTSAEAHLLNLLGRGFLHFRSFGLGYHLFLGTCSVGSPGHGRITPSLRSLVLATTASVRLRWQEVFFGEQSTSFLKYCPIYGGSRNKAT
jgi:hypothetical protein